MAQACDIVYRSGAARAVRVCADPSCSQNLSVYRCTIQHDTHDTHDLVRSRTILLIPDHFVAPSNVVQRFQVKLYSGLLIVWCYETVHTVEISGCNGGGAGGDSGTAALEVREREAHITATVRSAICVCDAVSVERLAAHDLARSCTIPHDLAARQGFTINRQAFTIC